jgi:ABC-type transporter Mla MlaB component
MVRLNNNEDRNPPRRPRRAKSADDLQPLVIRPVGDMTSCEQVRVLFQRCRRVIGEAGRRPVLLDLLGVAKADTKLIACLVAVYQMSRDSSVRLEMRASRVVLDLVDLCRLQRLVDRTSIK